MRTLDQKLTSTGGTLAKARSRRVRPLVAWLVAVWLVSGPMPARGQADAPAEQDVDNRFLPAPRTLLQRLGRGREAIREQQYNVAVDELGSILSPEKGEDTEVDIDQDYFIVDSDAAGAAPSLKAEAQRLIGAMPAQGRDLYELRYGAAARVLLDEAAREGSVGKLTDVTRRYFHTRAGYEAMLLLGRFHLDEGRPLAAALCFQRLSASAAARAAFDPELSILLAACWLLADAPERATQILTELRGRQPNAALRIGSENVRLFRDDTQALAWLRQTLGKLQGLADREGTSWALFRGNAARNARSQGGTPVVSHRWRVPTTNDPADEELVREQLRQLTSSGGILVPSVQPLAVGDVVLMRSPRRLLAVDFTNGKRIWEFPWDEGPDEQAERSMSYPAPRTGVSPRMSELNERLWRDAAYGQISSDGESAFFLHDLSYANSAAMQTLVGPGGFPQANENWPKTYNKLVALSLARQGALQWVVGGDDGADEPALAGVFFLGPPLPVLGQLYVLAEFQGELRLFVLDPQTGKLAWQQQLAHVDAVTIQHNPTRRLAGASPSFADGVLICPTSAGAVVALDISNRSLLWGFQHSALVNAQQLQRLGIGRVAMQSPVEESWLDATVTIANGRVLLTPVESGELHCLDLLTGAPLWAPQKRGDRLFVACVHGDRAVLVGKRAVTAVELRDGTPAWADEINLADEMPSGRGFYSDKYYYLPTSSAHLLKIDLDEGKVVDRMDTRVPLGNLICHRDQVLSHGAEWLATYYQFEPLQRWVEQRLRDDPQDREALARRCDLLLQEGKRREALETMWTTFQADPADDVLKAQLVETFLETLAEDFSTYSDWGARIETLLDQPGQRIAYLRLLSVGLQNGGDLPGAFAAVMRLADEVRTPTESGSPPLETVDRRWSVSRERWISGRIDALFAAAAGPERDELRRSWDDEIRRRLDVARQSGSRAAIRQFLEQFAAHPLAAEARLQYARFLVDAGELLSAELQLSLLLATPDRPRAAEATALLVKLLLLGQKAEEAQPFVQQLESQWPDTVVLDGKTGRQLAQEFAAAPALQQARQTLAAWPDGQVDVTTDFDPQRGLQMPQLVYPVQLVETRGVWSDGTTVRVDTRANSIVIRDAYGRDVQQALLANGRGLFGRFYNLAQAKANGHLVVVSLQSEVVAIDALRFAQDAEESILWRFDTNESVTNAPQRAIAHKTVRHPWSQNGVRTIVADASQARVPLASIGPVTSGGVCFQRFRQLVCVDPVSGETVWLRDGVDPGAALFGDDELLFVVPYDREEALVLNAATGELLGTRPVEKLEKRWATWGRHVLAWSEQGGKLTLRLYDAWSKTTLWQGEFPVGSRGELVADDEVAVCQPSGEFVIISLRTGKEQLRRTLASIPNLAYLYVQRNEDRYFVLPGQGVNPTPRVSIVAPPPPTSTPALQGNLYALRRSDGEPLWQSPATVAQFGVPLVQPTRAPVLAFFRVISQRSGQNRSQGSLLCIDKRDGRELLANDELPLQNPNVMYEITANPEADTVSVALSGHAFLLKFTDEPTAPAPPAQTGDNASLPSPYTSNRVRQAAGVVVDALEPFATGRTTSPDGN